MLFGFGGGGVSDQANLQTHTDSGKASLRVGSQRPQQHKDPNYTELRPLTKIII